MGQQQHIHPAFSFPPDLGKDSHTNGISILLLKIALQKLLLLFIF